MDYVNTGKLKSQISLEEFSNIFLNHKPPHSDDTEELKKVFKIINLEASKDKDENKDSDQVSRDDLVCFLKSKGEIFKEKDFVNYISPLFRINDSDEKNNEEHYNFEETVTYEKLVEVLKLN